MGKEATLNSFWTYVYNGLFMGTGLGTVLGAIIVLFWGPQTPGQNFGTMFMVMGIVAVLTAIVMVLVRNEQSAKRG